MWLNTGGKTIPTVMKAIRMVDAGRKDQSTRQSAREAFIDRFGGVYEHSSWVAESAFDKGIDFSGVGLDNLAKELALIVNEAGEERQLTLLRVHPDLAGRLALKGALTQSSSKEQQSAGLDQCTADELAKFQSLNSEYTNKFGFPFILAVSGRNRMEILANFESRVSNSVKEEFATALQEVHKIAQIRLAKSFKEQD
jgi:OHCU decarboxylase